jgi:hypothetical protein
MSKPDMAFLKDLERKAQQEVNDYNTYIHFMKLVEQIYESCKDLYLSKGISNELLKPAIVSSLLLGDVPSFPLEDNVKEKLLEMYISKEGTKDVLAIATISFV